MASLTQLWKVYNIFSTRQEVVMQELHKKYGKLPAIVIS
jgi:hypothetical protein